MKTSSPQPAILLLHGQPGSPADWRSVVDLLRKDALVLVPERPGYGQNVLPAGDFKANAQAMIDVLDKKGVEKAIVVGYSWSGGVAMQMAISHPDRVAGLVLVSSIGPGAVDRVDRLMVMPGIARISAIVAATLGGAAFHPRLRGALNRLTKAPLRNAAKAILRTNERRRLGNTFAVEQRAMVDQIGQLDSQLGSLRLPTVIVHARNDRLISIRTARALRALIPDSELLEMPRGAHYLPHKYPVEIAKVVDQIMKGAH